MMEGLSRKNGKCECGRFIPPLSKHWLCPKCREKHRQAEKRARKRAKIEAQAELELYGGKNKKRGKKTVYANAYKVQQYPPPKTTFDACNNG